MSWNIAGGTIACLMSIMEAGTMRTPILHELDKKLSEINRMLSYGSFISEQLLLDHSATFDAEPDKLTRDHFLANQYGNSFNLPLGQIRQAVREYQQASLTSFYIFVYTAFEVYTKKLLHLTRKITRSPLRKDIIFVTRGDTNRNLERTFAILGSNISSELDKHQRRTLDYIRMRRNGVVHIKNKPSEELVFISKKYGNKLNSYWRKSSINLHVLDFNTTDFNTFSSIEMIETIRILRDISEKIDHQVLSKVEVEKIVEHLLSDFKKRYQDEIKRKSRDRIENIFAAVAKREFGLDKHDINLEDIAF